MTSQIGQSVRRTTSLLARLLLYRPNAARIGHSVRHMTSLLALLLVYNLNTVTTTQLETLPGIGPTLAKRIVEFRERKGPFKRIEELLAVPGVSEKKWQTLREYLRVE